MQTHDEIGEGESVDLSPRRFPTPPIWASALAVFVAVVFPALALLRGMIAVGGIAGSIIGMTILVLLAYGFSLLIWLIAGRSAAVGRWTFGGLMCVLSVFAVLNLTLFAGNWRAAMQQAQQLQQGASASGSARNAGASSGGPGSVPPPPVQQLPPMPSHPAAEAGRRVAMMIPAGAGRMQILAVEASRAAESARGEEKAARDLEVAVANNLHRHLTQINQMGASFRSPRWVDDLPRLLESSGGEGELRRRSRVFTDWSQELNEIIQVIDPQLQIPFLFIWMDDEGDQDARKAFQIGWAHGLAEREVFESLQQQMRYVNTSSELISMLGGRYRADVVDGRIRFPDSTHQKRYDHLIDQIRASWW